MLSDYSWKYFPDIGRSTGEYILFYQGVPIDHFTHVLGPVAQSSAESIYNSEWTAGMDISHFRILNNELLKKDTDVVPEQAPLIILDSKSAIYMDKNSKDTKNTRYISRRIHF